MLRQVTSTGDYNLPRVIIIGKYRVMQLCAVGFTVEKLLLPLIDEFNKHYDVTTVCSSDGVSQKLKNRGYKIENIDIDRKISPIKNLKSVFKLYRYIKREKFDVVHVHTPVAGILGRIAAKLAGVPVIIYTAHGFYFHDNMPALKKKLFILIEKIGGWLCDYIFTQSTEDYHTAVNMKIIDENSITAIGNGVDIERFSAESVNSKTSADQIRDELGIGSGDIVIGIIGRVVREKGYVEWIMAAKEVLKKHKNIKFIAIGDTLESDRDGVKSELDRLINENGINNNVIFTGSRSDIPELLSIMDIFTLPSYREGMPRSIIEAMCMAKPVVATNIRGCREEVVEGETGFLVPVQDYGALSERLVYLIENEAVRASMGKKARQKAEAEYDEKKVIKKQLDIVNSLIEKRK